MHKTLAAIGAFATVLGIDQLSKAWIHSQLVYRPGGRSDEIVLIQDWLHLTHARNTGAAFSTLDGAYWVFLSVGFFALAMLVLTFVRQPRNAVVLPAIIGTLAAGACGNLLDRLRHGYVVDMVQHTVALDGPQQWLIHQFGTATWPIYNVADVALLVGIAGFALTELLFSADTDDADDGEWVLGETP